MNHHWPGSDIQGMTHNLLGSVSKTGTFRRTSTDKSCETATEGTPMHLPPDLPVAGPAAVIQWLQAKGSLTFTGQPQTVAGLRTAEERRKAAALAFLGKEAMALEMHPVTLSFREPKLEAEFLNNVAVRRRYVLMFIMCFDVLCYLFRLLAKYVKNKASETSEPGSVLSSLMPQLLNMAFLYVFLGLLNWRSRRLGNGAARQEELLLSGIMALAICNLLATLRPSNAQDYVFAGMFLMCTSTFLKIRWLVGTVILTLPLVLVFAWPRTRALLPADAEVHLTVSWAVGSLMSFLADSWRRQMFANHKLASAAAEKELQEAQARATVQQQLAAAQAQAAHRALTVAREKAANEAKSEFMSLMCHEVRTPLNGCLASAEMLLETPLQDEQRELAKTICVSGSILLSTVSNFLDFFKMEAGKQLDVVRSEINIKELVNDIHCIIEAMIGRESDVKLLRPCTEAVPDFVMGDPDRLKGVLLNLYTNAAKFTKEGTISLRVRVAGPHYRPTPHDLTMFAGGTVPGQSGSQPSGGEPVLGPLPAHEAPSTAERQQQQRQAPPPPLQGRRQGFPAVSERLPPAQQQPAVQQQVAVSKAAQSRAAAALLKSGAASRRSSLASSRSSGGHSEHSLDAFFREPAALANGCDGYVRASAPSQVKQPYQEAQGFSSAFSGLEASRAERHASSRQASTSASEPGIPRDGASPASEEVPGRQLQAPLAHSQTNGLSHGARAAEAPQEATEQRRALSAGLLASAMAQKRSLDGSVPPKKTRTASFEEVAPPACNGKTPFSTLAFGEPFTEEDEDDLVDASESDVDRARTSNSAPDVSERQSSVPCRKSFSSPADIMDAASNAAVSALVAEGRLPGRGTSISTTRKATLGRGMECKVEPLGRGWFNAVATQPPSSQRGTSSSSSTHSSTDRRRGSPGERQPQQWLVFEVADSGCGIGEAGLRSLFKDYVQGTEDEMRRPRSRGGTGLGLSICSKQVAVLGGHIGAMSKVHTGSTFWFTVPLLLPEHSPKRSLTLRRTASWGSRNAFSDGHISDFDQAATLPGRMNRAVTRPHQYRRQSHQLARSGTWLDQQGSQVRRSQQLTRGALAQQERHSQDGSMQGRSTSEPEQTHQNSMDRSPPRRRSAPEAPANIAAIRLAAYKGQLDAAKQASDAAEQASDAAEQASDAAAAAAAEAAQAASPLQQGTSSQARAAVARAVLCSPAKPDDLPVLRRSMSRDPLRSSLRMEPMQGGVAGSESDQGILQEGVNGNGPLAEYCPPQMLGPHYAAVQRSAAEQHQLRKHQHQSHLVHRGEQEVPNGLHEEVHAPGPPPCTSALATGVTHGSLEPLPEMQVKVQELPAELGSQRRTSSFSATEPCLRQDLTAMVSAPPPAASVRRQQERPSMEARRRKLDTSALQGRNVLLAEDNLINQTVAKKMLCSLGMVVEVAANGLDAVDAVRRRQQRNNRPFDVILMDMAMPVMGGVEATKTIRQGKFQQDTPIIAMTANASDKDRDECLGAGMDGFLSKPVLKDRLSEAILSVISGRRQFSDKNTVAIKALERF